MLIRSIRARVNVRPGFFLLLGFIFYLDDRSGSLLTVFAAAAVHEAGHIAACIMMGGKIETIDLSAVGAQLDLNYPTTISYGRENIILLAGAAANLILGTVSFFLSVHQMTYISVGLGTFNLLPIIPLDGGRILYNLVAERFGIVAAETVTIISSGIFIGLLTGIGAVLALKFANWIPIIISGWLLAGIMRKKTIYS